MKAVRAGEGRVAVVDVDEPPGTGELLDMQATSEAFRVAGDRASGAIRVVIEP